MDAYKEALKRAKTGAEQGFLVTFGIEPTLPATGYGYIFARPAKDGLWGVERFVEKPDLDRAKEYVSYRGEDGRYFWNSGMFCFRAGVYLDELKKHRPDIWEAAKEAFEQAKKGEFLRIAPKYMHKIPDESVDYAVMERSQRIAMVPSGFGWSDLGDFDALYEQFDKDGRGNTKVERYVAHNAKNNFLFGKYRMIAVSEVDDLIIVDTPSALLVTKRGAAQSVRQVVKKIKQIDPQLVKFGRTVYRPWGSFTILEECKNFKVKRLVVKPGRRLSLQKHLHRSEHWVVVRGSAQVRRGDESFLLRPNESTYIPIGTVHRLENPGRIDLEVIEVQVGEYLGEDDIIRIKDDYERR
jgi:mannose-1-phosphate guanylyltransferase